MLYLAPELLLPLEGRSSNKPLELVRLGELHQFRLEMEELEQCHRPGFLVVLVETNPLELDLHLQHPHLHHPMLPSMLVLLLVVVVPLTIK